MKTILVIFLSFAVLAFSMQLPCRAIMAEQEQGSCSSDHCCGEESSDQEESPRKMKGNENCCVYNVLSVTEMPQFEYRQVFSLQLKTGFVNQLHASNYSNEFWQPPRSIV